MNLIIKSTDRNEFFQTECLTREAFWNLYKPGCDEHLVLHQLRQSACYVPRLDIAALSDGEIVGHVISTIAKVSDCKGADHEVLCVGPISVTPGLQGKGIGSQLMRHSIGVATIMGFKAMILFGDPAYYSRFGFENAQRYTIVTRDNQNFDPFMALELQPGSLTGITGRFFEDDAFLTTETDLEFFEKLFPAREKGKPKIILPI